jgi:hypothetical protein
MAGTFQCLLTGPRWSRAIVQYVPAVFADACRDSSRTAVNLFDTNTENPELIWNDEARELVKIGVRMERDKMSEVASTAVNQWKVCTHVCARAVI